MSISMQREVVGDLLLLGHARDFLLDGLRTRPCFRVVELLDQENERGGHGHGDSAGGEQALTFAPRRLIDHLALDAEARLRRDLSEVIFAPELPGSSPGSSVCDGCGLCSGGMGIGGMGFIAGAVVRIGAAAGGLAHGRRRCTRRRRCAQWRFRSWLHHARGRGTSAARGDRNRGRRRLAGVATPMQSTQRRGRARRNRRARRGAARRNAALIEHHAFDGAIGLVVRSAGDLRDGKPQLFEVDRVVDRALHFERREARAEQLQALGCGREDALERNGGAGSSA